MSQPRPTQQQGFGNMQLWQQHLMHKQLEIQRQRQLQQQNLGGKQHNTIGHLSDVARHSGIMQSPPVFSGMPINRPSDHSWSSELMRGESKVPNSSLVFHAGNMNWAQRAGPQIRGDGVVFSHDQGQTAHPQEFVQHHGGQQSLYGTTLSGTRYFSNQYPQLQGLSHDSSDLMMNRSGGNSAENVSIQPTTLSYLKNDQSVFTEHGFVQDHILVAKQGIQGRSSFGSVQVQGPNSGVMLGNFRQTNQLAQSVQAQEFQGGQERDNWSRKLHECKVLQVGPSCGMTDIDPTKEKLYTITDGHCDVSFGDSTITNTGSNHHINHMHNCDRTSAFSSIQSGSWSALMMDALEASSSDTGPQEEWSGLNFVKAESSHQNQFAPLNNNGKHQLHWDEKNLQSASSLTSSSHPSVNNADVSPNHHSFASYQQSTKFAYEENESLSTEVSHESSQHSFKDEKNTQFNECHQRNQFVRGSPGEQTSFDNVSDGLWAGQMHRQPVSTRHSVDMGQNMQMARDNQHRILLGNTDNMSSGKSISWNVNQSPAEVSTSSILDNVNPEGHELEHGGNQVVIPFPNSVGGQEPVKSETDSTKMWDKDSNMDNFFLTDSSSLNFNQEMKQELFYQHLRDSGKHVATHSFLNSEGAESAAWHQTQLSRCQQFRQSSLNTTMKNEAGEALCQNQESCNLGDVPDEGYMPSHSQLSLHADSGSGPRENSFTTGNNSGLLVSSCPNSSGQNYSQGPNHSVLRGLNNHEQGDIGLVTHPRYIDATKEQLTDTQRNPQVGGELHSSCAIPRHYPASWSYDALNTHVSQNNWVGPASHNMLELLHKVAQPPQWQPVSDNDLASQASSTTSVPSLPLANQVPPDKFNNGSNIYGQMDKTSSSSIGANPWAFTTSNLPYARDGSAMQQQQQQQQQQQENVSNVTRFSLMDQSPNPSVGGQVNIDAYVQHFSHLRQQGFSDKNMHAQPSQKSSHSAASHFPSSRLDPSRGTCAPASSRFQSFSSGPSQPVYSSSLPGTSGQKLSVLEARSAAQPSSTSDMPQQGGFSSMLHKVCSGLSEQQHQSILQAKKIISQLPRSLGALPNNSMGRKLWAQKLDNQCRQIGGSVPSDFQQELNGRTRACDSSLDFQKEHFILNANVQKRNYSELQQVQAMQGLNSDPTKRIGKRLKGEDVGADAPQMELAASERFIYEQSALCGELDADSQHSSFPSDVKMLSFSRDNEDEPANTYAQLMSIEKPSEDLLTSGQINMQNNTHYLNQTSTITSLNECPQINSQTAPSFEQSISYINGQLVATCDGPGNIQGRAKATTQHYPFAKLCKNRDNGFTVEHRDDATQVGTLPNITLSTALAVNDNSFAHSMPPNAIDTNVVLITKKRKTATSELLPWHKELAQDSQRLLSVSTSQLNWAKAANRLIEKVEDDSEMIVCKSSTTPRRRLILTTQLMQQLLPPVPATFLRADAITSYESVTFFVAKLSLGEACSLAFCSGSDSLSPSNSENIIPEKLESSEEGRVHFLARGIDGFVGRRKKVESDLLRLEAKVSMLDVMVECRALDRFSTINRLAKFHGPPQTAATRSSSTTATLSSTTFTQRHVTAHTITAHPPKDMLCLSL